jgi:hypothetical protein
MTAELQPAPALETEATLNELAAKFPEPDWHAAAADRFWLGEQQLAGAFDVYEGKTVAAYNKQVIGVGDHYVRLLVELSTKYNIHPGRIAFVYIGDEFA